MFTGKGDDWVDVLELKVGDFAVEGVVDYSGGYMALPQLCSLVEQLASRLRGTQATASTTDDANKAVHGGPHTSTGTLSRSPSTRLPQAMGNINTSYVHTRPPRSDCTTYVALESSTRGV